MTAVARQTWRVLRSQGPELTATRRTYLHRPSFPGPSAVFQNTRRGYATPSSDPISAHDPADVQASRLSDEGMKALDQGDVQRALSKYNESLAIKETSYAWYNLGVCEYWSGNVPQAIEAWEKSLVLGPSADAYMNLASAYVMSKPPQPAKAITCLTSAMDLSPEDPEIAFNLAAILESTGNLEQSLELYQRAEKGGVERAAQNIRSVSAKILTGKQSQSRS